MNPLPPLNGPNLPAIFLAVLAMQALAFLFYAPGFLGGAWLRAWGLAKKKVNSRDPVPFVLSVTQAAVAAMSLDYLLRHLGWPGVLGGLRLALYVWLGFLSLSLAVHYRYAKVSSRALLIDAGFELAQLCVAGLIVGAWR